MIQMRRMASRKRKRLPPNLLLNSISSRLVEAVARKKQKNRVRQRTKMRRFSNEEVILRGEVTLFV